jgi:hypothetical protein
VRTFLRRVGKYYPDPARPERSFAMAVLAASPDSLALAGVFVEPPVTVRPGDPA